ncbi:thiol:disulfide interchange protein DsbG [Delftia sp. JD2]|uniref:thiol:disulfide interchange protein DsbG n=1 Tax=Delftia sp. JD2 TaxID=469553 RepID=UPI00080688A3|nr:thiol:disulfide interchange protein DsbG [Delftia sp. JD2]
MKKYVISALICGAIAAASTAWSFTGPQARPPVLNAIEANGVSGLKEFKVNGELRGFAGLAGQEPIAVYVGKDGNAIVGTRITAAGEPMDTKAIDELVRKPAGELALKRLESSRWIQDGKADAPRVIYVITDPNCPWCHRLSAAARPWVSSGKVQLRHLLVGVIRADSEAKAAAILTSPKPQEALQQNERDFDKGGIAALKTISNETKQVLRENVTLMSELGFRGTPALVYRGPQGAVEMLSGFPQGAQMQQVFGPQ